MDKTKLVKRDLILTMLVFKFKQIKLSNDFSSRFEYYPNFSDSYTEVKIGIFHLEHQ